MAIQPELVQMLRALLSGQFDSVAPHVGQAEGGVRLWDAATGLLNAAFWLAVNRRFDADTGIQDIANYVTQVRRAHPDAEAMVAEALIRAARGEEHVMTGLNPDTTLPVQMVLLHELASDENLTDDQRQAFVSEAVRIAERSLRQ